MITRLAVATDAATIAEIHVLSWQQGYRGLLPQTFLDSLDPAQRVAHWRASLEEQDPPHRATIVVADEAQPLGFVDICPTRDGDEQSSPVGEVTSIYLRPDAWGKGLGQRLITDACGLLKDAGNVAATLWVLRGNTRATHFYEVNGWAPDGAIKDATIADATVTEIRYRTTLL